MKSPIHLKTFSQSSIESPDSLHILDWVNLVSVLIIFICAYLYLSDTPCFQFAIHCSNKGRPWTSQVWFPYQWGTLTCQIEYSFQKPWVTHRSNSYGWISGGSASSRTARLSPSWWLGCSYSSSEELVRLSYFTASSILTSFIPTHLIGDLVCHYCQRSSLSNEFVAFKKFKCVLLYIFLSQGLWAVRISITDHVVTRIRSPNFLNKTCFKNCFLSSVRLLCWGFTKHALFKDDHFSCRQKRGTLTGVLLSHKFGFFLLWKRGEKFGLSLIWQFCHRYDTNF